MSHKRSEFLLLLDDAINNRRVLACKKPLMKSQWLKKEQLREHQTEKLRRLLKHAYGKVPYYRKAFNQADFKPDDFRDYEDLQKVPILKRATLLSQTDSIISNDTQKRRLISWKTSGTTSAPVKFFRDKADVSWGVAAELRGYSWAGYEIGKKLALVWTIDPIKFESLRFKLQNYLTSCVVFNNSTLSEESMKHFAEKMERFKPDFVRGYTGSLNIFAAFLTSNSGYSLNPRAVFTSASALLPHYRRNIERAFNCRVYDYYASAEMSHIAAQCGHHEGLHISEENVAVEIVKDGEHAAAGEEGHVILTNLQAYAMPFIRYDIGDLGKIYDEDCSCGRGLRLMRPIGRKYEFFINSDGSFTAFRHIQTVFEDLPIQDFQIVQESLDDILIKIVRGNGYGEEDSDFIMKNIKFRGRARVRIEYVDQIPLQSSGKLRHVVSRIASKYILD